MQTEDLIASLVDMARPVQRLRPPLLRAGLWLFAVAALAAAGILAFANLGVFSARIRDPKLAWELTGTVATGAAAIIAAFYLSLPDRSRGWALLPLPPLALWIGASGYNCYRHWLNFGPDGWSIGESAHCFAFILGLSAPLALTLYLALRRSYTLTPVSVAAMGGLGVAGIAAFVLQFFHPFDVTFMDLGLHLAAVALVVSLASLAGNLADRRAQT